MKAKLCVFVMLFAFTGSASAEYYLVYPASGSSTCYDGCSRADKKHVSKKKTYQHVAHKSKRNSYKIEVYYPCTVYVAGCDTCGACSSCSSCGCGYAYPDYVVYTARPSDCTTYEDVMYGHDGY